MAGAKTGVHVVQLREIQVPESLIRGNKFIKWDDENSMGVPVTLKVDPKGYILYWRDQVKETDCLDICLIRDTRTGRPARLPKDQRLRDLVSMGCQDTSLEDKMLTIVHSTDTVNVSYTNFAANSREVAREWADELFRCATNLLALNRCPLSFLEKCYTKLCLVTSAEGMIPVKNIVRMFAQHRDDKKKIEKALEAAQLPTGKNDCLHPKKFPFRQFMSFYRHLCGRQEVDKIFYDLGSRKKPYLTAQQFVKFLNDEQRDPRLNEILYPYYDTEKAQTIIDHFELNPHMAIKDPEVPKGHLSQEGFLQYLLGEHNALITPEKLDLSEDMDQPLAHYFINSSHNTYLSGHQLTGRSSVEIYRQVLLTGCRCIELDCWDGHGADEEPIITHGFTMCTEILFKEVVEAIAETAFKVSDYPVILSFENHCSQKQQVKMAQHCRTILGDLLLTEPLESHKLEQGVPLPSPAMLKRKIIIKNKKRHSHKSKTQRRKAAKTDSKPTSETAESSTTEGEEEVVAKDNSVAGESSIAMDTSVARENSVARDSGVATDNSVAGDNSVAVETSEAVIEDKVEETEDIDMSSESEESDEEDLRLTEEEAKRRQNEKKEKGTAGQEAEAGMEMSELVSYIQPVRFHSFEISEKRSRSYECTSFVETQATALLKETPLEFVNYNKRQLTRIYPRGTRVDSSNYMPQIFWNAGCQLVALNFQTLDLALQLNLGIFEYNGRSGYILKPDFMRRHDRRFDPFAESTVDGIVAGSVTIKVISGQLLTDKKVGTYVEVEMYGLPADTVRKKFRTKVVPANGINPTYDEEPFVFKKVVLPNLATLRIVVCEENGRLLGQRVLPVEGLRPGYRHICLRNELNEPQNLATLFVHVKVGDYVPDAFADFAAALANPIAYQSALEKHAQQLAVLEEEMEEDRQYGMEQETFEETDGTTTRQDRNCTRTNSVLSKHSSSGETPGGSSGGGTPTHLCKQDSVGGSRSQNATGGVTRASSRRGASSHSSSLCDQSSRAAAVSAVSENGAGAAGSNQFSVLATTKLAGVSSLPSSPLHSVSGRPNLMENGVPHPTHVPPQPKVDVSQTSRLKDPELLESVSLEQLKETKPFQKLLAKQDKEVEGLRRKLEKAQQILREVHGLQEEKLLLSQIKGKGTLQKAYRKSVKRASRRGNTSADAPSLQDALTPDQLRKHREQKMTQAEEMMALCREHYKTEADVTSHYVLLLNNALCHAIDVRQEALLKQLDDIHDREVTELRKKLDTYNHDEMKALAKKHKEKNELSRIKREAMKKHITLAVQERQKLQDLLDRRKADVVEMFDALRQRAAEDKVKATEAMMRAYDARCARLEQEHREIFSTSVSESTSLASPHCQTPGVTGGNSRSIPEVTKM